jgi:hypothetical protein
MTEAYPQAEKQLRERAKKRKEQSEADVTGVEFFWERFVWGGN